MIYTFYSYKGGVGRSMALANVAEWFYRQGLRVVMVDWDLEAPGLENFFFATLPKDERGGELELIRTQLGLIDNLMAYKRQHARLGLPSDESDPAKLVDILHQRLPPITDVLYPIHQRVDPASEAGQALWLLPAGLRAEDRFTAYAQTVQSFDWAAFYSQSHGEAYFEWLRQQLLAPELADVVLIDSRTDVTEMGGVCTRQLADAVVSFCVPNEQSLDGVVKMARSFKNAELLAARNGRPLEIIVVPTRLDASEITDRNRFEKEFRSKLERDEFVPRAFRQVNADFWHLGIPYVPKYAYKERLAIGDPNRPDHAQELEDAYTTLATALALVAPQDSALRRHVSSELRQAYGQLLPKVAIVPTTGAGRALAAELRSRLQKADITLWEDLAPVVLTEEGWHPQWWPRLSGCIDQCEFVLLSLTAETAWSSEVRQIWRYARQRGVCIYPVASAQSAFDKLPIWLARQRIYRWERDWELLSEYVQRSCRTVKTPDMAPPLLATYVPRPDLIKTLTDKLLDSAGNPQITSVSLWGMAGVGKTVLTTALCQDEAIADAFDDGILWVTLGQEPDLLANTIKICGAISGEQRTFATLDSAISYLVGLLHGKSYLLVIDDVWSLEHLLPDQVQRLPCAALITTRDHNIAARMQHQITVDPLTTEQGMQMIAQVLNQPVSQTAQLAALVERLGGLPLALEIAALWLKRRSGRGDSLEMGLVSLLDKLARQGVSAIDRDTALAQSLERRLQALTANERQRLIDLATTPVETVLSVKRASELWKLDPTAAEILVDTFHDHALLTIEPPDQRIQLHPVMRSYLRYIAEHAQALAAPKPVNQEQGGVVIGGNITTGTSYIYPGHTVEQVAALISETRTALDPKPFTGRCPYVGLAAFDVQDADLFFGREQLIADLLERVKVANFITIAGPSGSGKSSVVRAGLLPALMRGNLSGSDQWLYATLRPGREPLQELALAIARMAQSPTIGDYIRKEGGIDRDALYRTVETLLSDRRDQRAVIFVDQFEEIFTQTTHEGERAIFLDLLTHAATAEHTRIIVLVALRSDFLTDCAKYPQLRALLTEQFVLVGPMRSEELTRAIILPAQSVGLRVDPDLVAQIVTDVKGEPGALPLVQWVLRDLFYAQQTKEGVNALTLSDYLERGGIHQSLGRYADAEFNRLTEPERQGARLIFSHLIEISPDGQNSRRTASFSELATSGRDEPSVSAVIQKLANARLVSTEARDNENVTVTLAHEILLDAWPWLRRLIDESREAIVLQNEINEAALEWNRHQRDDSYLYIGTRLANVQEQLASQRLVLNVLSYEFIQAGVRTDRRQKIRWLMLSMIITLLTVVLTAITLLWRSTNLP